MHTWINFCWNFYFLKEEFYVKRKENWYYKVKFDIIQAEIWRNYLSDIHIIFFSPSKIKIINNNNNDNIKIIIIITFFSKIIEKWLLNINIFFSRAKIVLLFCRMTQLATVWSIKFSLLFAGFTNFLSLVKKKQNNF